MNDDDLENWEPESAKPDLESLEKHAFPFREDPKYQERRALCITASSRRYECPGCGILKNVEPVFTGDEWMYFGQCSHCGVKWCNAYHLMRRCEDCNKKVAMTSKNPMGRCACEGEAIRPF